jgi:hypothetical protein
MIESTIISYLLFFFVITVFFGSILELSTVRVIALGIFVTPLVILGIRAANVADESPGSLSRIVVIAFSTLLIVLGTAAPRRCYWATRIVGLEIGVIFWGMAILGTFVADTHLRRWFTGPLDPPIDWCLAIVIGLPCLWFAARYRPAPMHDRFHVLMIQPCPNWELWQRALIGQGFELVLHGTKTPLKHAGRLNVTFQGVGTGFEFDVCPLSKLVVLKEMDPAVAEVSGNERLSANFRYDGEDEEEAALVAAAVLTKLTAGEMFTEDRQRWLGADDALEAAQDIALPLELSVVSVLDQLPSAKVWQEAMAIDGITCEFPDTFDWEDYAGFLRGEYHGARVGFALATSPAGVVVGGDEFPATEAPPEVFNMTAATTFRFAAGNHAEAARIAVALLAKLSDGIVFDPSQATFRNGADARDAMRSNDAGDQDS